MTKIPNKLIEKVARAICSAERMSDDALGGWRYWTETAEAAIGAAGVGELIEALKPFAEACRDNIDCDPDKWRDGDELWESSAAMALTAGNLRAAVAALAKIGISS